MDLTVPPLLAEKITGWFGAVGQAWLETLPDTVAALSERWDLDVRCDAPYQDGHVSWTARARRRGDGSPVVLKIPYLDRESLHEADALRDYAGEGAVLLLDHDASSQRDDGAAPSHSGAASGAMLLEWLNPGTPVRDLPPEEGVDIVCALLRRLRRIPAPGHPYQLVSDEAARWADRLEHAARGDHAVLPPWIAERAAWLARKFAAQPGATLVNRDANLGNFLRAEREPWLMIDPKPLVGDPAFDSGHLLIDTLRTDPSPRRTAQFAARVADGLGVDREQVHGWVLVRAALNCLWETGDYATANLAIAESVIGL